MSAGQNNTISRRLAACLIAGIVFALSGCGPRAETKALLEAETSTLQPLSVLYGQYQNQHENRVPADENEFRRFIQSRGQSVLQQFETDIDQLFISSRDGQPYVVFYRNNPPPPSGVIAHEREGVDGQRIVAYPFGSVSMVDEARFRELVPGAS